MVTDTVVVAGDVHGLPVTDIEGAWLAGAAETVAAAAETTCSDPLSRGCDPDDATALCTPRRRVGVRLPAIQTRTDRELQKKTPPPARLGECGSGSGWRRRRL
jgi:hypothetical protein